jgi:hypothetical protein
MLTFDNVCCQQGHLFSQMHRVQKMKKAASTGTKEEGWSVLWDFFCKEIFGRDFKKPADIQGGPVFWGSGLESFTVVNYNNSSDFNKITHLLMFIGN